MLNRIQPPRCFRNTRSARRIAIDRVPAARASGLDSRGLGAATILRVAAILLALLIPTRPLAALPAFPGAEGFGAETPGGRGGQVIYVEHLGDGPDVYDGSLRAAIDASGPRTIVFAVSGIIDLQARLIIDEPFVTIAGQSAPGDGITLRNGGPVNNYLIRIETHDVVIRHLRIRPGPSQISGGSSRLGGINISGSEAHDIVLDHVSITWAEDKALTIFDGAADITVQNSLLAETLACANHFDTIRTAGSGGSCPNGGFPHSRLITISNFPGSSNAPDRLTFHHNLLANTNKRYPNINSNTFVDMRNNVTFNPGVFVANLISGKNPDDRAQLNYVENVVLPGPETAADIFAVISDRAPDNGQHELYIADNLLEYPVEPTTPGFSLINRVLDAPLPAPIVATTDATTALEQVVTQVGTWPRDAADRRLIAGVCTGFGRFVDDPSQVGGWPMLVAAEPPFDTDGDGIPDAEETADPVLDPTDPDDAWADPDGDGYGALEAYLNGLADQRIGESASSAADAWRIQPPVGHYHDPDHFGHGLDFQRSGESYFAIFYTYELNGLPTWYLAVGELTNSRFEAEALRYRYDDGAIEAIAGSGGTLSLDFAEEAALQACGPGRTSAATAQFQFDLDGHSDTWCLEPFRFGAEQAMPNLTGSWFDPDESGWGLTLQNEKLGEEMILEAILFFYDSVGEPRWVFGHGAMQDNTARFPMFLFQGNCPGCTTTRPQVEPLEAGTIELETSRASLDPEIINRVSVDITLPEPLNGTWFRETDIRPLSNPGYCAQTFRATPPAS